MIGIVRAGTLAVALGVVACGQSSTSAEPMSGGSGGSANSSTDNTTSAQGTGGSGATTRGQGGSATSTGVGGGGRDSGGGGSAGAASGGTGGGSDAEPPQILSESQKLLANAGAELDWLAWEVAAGDDVVLLGTTRQDAEGYDVGAVVSFSAEAGTFTEDQLFAPDDAPEQLRFGAAVALDGDTAVVTARFRATSADSGVAFVLQRQGGVWSEQQRLLPSTPLVDDWFGRSAALNGDSAAVGADGDDQLAIDAGAVYIFVRESAGFVEQAKLTASDGAEEDYFGCNVAVSGGTLVVGAYGDDDRGDFAGAAYVFERNGETWQETQKLLASDGKEAAEFGGALAVSGDTLLVGAGRDPTLGLNVGAVYVFERRADGFVETQKLVASDGMPGDAFGSAVALRGDRAVFGAPSSDDNGNSAGSAYFFERTDRGFQQVSKLLPASGLAEATCGTGVGLTLESAIVGCPLDDELADAAGAAYVFELP